MQVSSENKIPTGKPVVDVSPKAFVPRKILEIINSQNPRNFDVKLPLPVRSPESSRPGSPLNTLNKA